MTDTAAAPVVLAPPLAADERTRFLQNALHGGQFQSGQETRADLQQTERVEDSKEPRQEQSKQEPQRDANMGLLSVLTGNINPPTPDMSSPTTRDASNAHGTISNDLTATTVGPTTNQGLIRGDTARTGFQDGTDTRERVGGDESPVTPTRDGHRAATPLARGGTPERTATTTLARGTTPERTATPLARSPTPLGDRSPTPAPRSATLETGPTPGATGDGYSPLPVLATTGDRDRAPSPLPDSVRGDRADLDVRDGFEQGLPARQGVDGHYEGIRGEESASRPP